MTPSKIGLATVISAFGVLSLTAANCDLTDATGPAEINLQVSGSSHLSEVLTELNARGLRATFWLSANEIDQACDLVATLPERGHEIAGLYPEVIKSNTSYAAQEAELKAIIEASNRCAQRSPAGFRGVGASHNASTYRLLDDYGLRYTTRSNVEVPLTQLTTEPYLMSEHAFTVLPTPVTLLYGQRVDLCADAAKSLQVSRPTIAAEQIVSFHEASIDHFERSNDPLVIEWDTSLTNPDNAACWTAFTRTLNYIVDKGSDVRDVTAFDLVRTHPATDIISASVPIVGSGSD